MRSEGLCGQGLKPGETPGNTRGSANVTPDTLDPGPSLRSCSVSLHFLSSPALCELHFHLPYSSTPPSPYSLPQNSRLNHALLNRATSSEPPPYLNIKLPDLSAPLPEPEVHVVGLQPYHHVAKSTQVTSRLFSRSPRTFGSLLEPRQRPRPPYLKSHRSPRSS
jgi:hypothetical protein